MKVCKGKRVVIYDGNKIWSKTINLWCKEVYGFSDVVVFNDSNSFYEYVEENVFEIDLCIINFYDEYSNNTKLIKKCRKVDSDLLIIAVSANFINDNEVLDTEEMIKALNAGANRATIKDKKQLEIIIEEHLNVRAMENFKEIKTDPEAFKVFTINKRKQKR